ncbi:hypothetical protein AOQ88_00800 [Candidatus Riesia sp. GBBU]|nr:hypothetical protein AOQ88_00800 [Candidatus Riesia sp. GBBU]
MKNRKKIKFSKIHSSHNEFLIVDSTKNDIFITGELVRKLSSQNVIGFDQFILIKKSNIINVDFFYRIFNSDGSEAEQCGNGAICISNFVINKNLVKKREVVIHSKSGRLTLKKINKNLVSVNMGTPSIIKETAAFQIEEIKSLCKKIFCSGVVYIGNFHFVIITLDLEIDFFYFKRNIEKKNFFLETLNIEFIQIVNYKHIKARVYEKGSGETKSCGSGACAAVFFGIKNGILKDKVIVDFPGGKLKIIWNRKKKSIFIIGSSNHIYDGVFYYKNGFFNY